MTVPSWSVLTVEQAEAMIRRHERRRSRERRVARLRLMLPPLRLFLALLVLAWSLGLL